MFSRLFSAAAVIVAGAVQQHGDAAVSYPKTHKDHSKHHAKAVPKEHTTKDMLHDGSHLVSKSAAALDAIQNVTMRLQEITYKQESAAARGRAAEKEITLALKKLTRSKQKRIDIATAELKRRTSAAGATRAMSDAMEEIRALEVAITDASLRKHGAEKDSVNLRKAAKALEKRRAELVRHVEELEKSATATIHAMKQQAGKEAVEVKKLALAVDDLRDTVGSLKKVASHSPHQQNSTKTNASHPQNDALKATKTTTKTPKHVSGASRGMLLPPERQ